MKKFEVEMMVLLLCFGLTANVSAVLNSGLEVKSGDWIKYNIKEGPLGGEYLQKMEFIEVEETNVTVRLTTYMPSGVEMHTQTATVNLTSQDDFQTIPFSLRVYIISSNTEIGDFVYLGNGFGSKTINGEMTRAYAGVDRKVVYSNFSQDGSWCMFCWDKQTGVLVEGIMFSSLGDKAVWVVETNMWSREFEWWLFAVAIIAVACGIITSKFRKKGLNARTAILTVKV